MKTDILAGSTDVRRKGKKSPQPQRPQNFHIVAFQIRAFTCSNSMKEIDDYIDAFPQIFLS